MELAEKIKAVVREVQNFPKVGINFKDITPVLMNHELSREIVEAFALEYQDKKIDAVIGVESRGFLFGMMLAGALKVPFITVRKSGKLPFEKIAHEYELEYGKAVMEMHIDALQPGWNVVIHDDLLATGGTASAAAELVQMQNSQVAGFAFMLELKGLNGREKLSQYSEDIFSLVKYDEQ